jgi:ribose transport system ATP-binding protein
MGKPLLQVKEITKSFPGVTALNKVSFDLYKNEVLAIIGENGAGKSTLIKILSGIYKLDEGIIIFKDREIKVNSPRDAQELGISTIYQEFNLIPNLTVGKNICFGREKLFGTFLRFFKVVDWKKVYETSHRYMQILTSDIDTKVKVSELSVAQQQLVEIAKALSFKSQILIMDEPTSALEPEEVKKLFQIIGDLKNQGVAILFITHRIEEVFEIADRIVVLRDGELINIFQKKEATKGEVIKSMVGREITSMFPKVAVETGDKILEIKNLSSKESISNLNFYLKKGEILGFAGLMGAGQTDIAKTIFGLIQKTEGEIVVDGNKVDILSPQDAINFGIGYLPENRKEEGLILKLSVRDNMVLLYLKKLANLIFLKKKQINTISEDLIKKLNIKTPSLLQKVMFLSGGNQQKIVLAKWLLPKLKVLILNDPTRGIDVGAKVEIHTIMTEIESSLSRMAKSKES